MGDYLYHYTSRQLAQEITISGKLRPRYGGRVYLTQDSYQQGATAAARLAMINKPVEVVFAISKDKVPNPSNERHVESIIGADGTEIRPGCGTEIWTEQEINIAGVAVWGLAWP